MNQSITNMRKAVYIITEKWYQKVQNSLPILTRSDTDDFGYDNIEEAIKTVKEAISEMVLNGEPDFNAISEDDSEAVYVQKEPNCYGMVRKFTIKAIIIL